MTLKQIELTDFRNIEHLKIYPSDNLTVICGKNGQGKTNLLESIWMLTGAKSFRGAKDSELIRQGCEFAKIKSIVDIDERANDEKEINITVCQTKDQKKYRKATINGVEYARAAQIAGTVNCIVFEPNHLRIIKGSPDGRRKFLDTALCQLYPQYLANLRKYTRLTAQKNALLKNYKTTNGAADMLDIYNEKLAECGEIITKKRTQYISNTHDNIVKNYDEISMGAEKLSIKFNPCFNADKESLFEVLTQNKQRDINASFCTKGPHREDFTIYIDDKESKIYASQGQQRSAVLSLKLAEAAECYNVTAQSPIVLLDDVLSELDDSRQSFLLNNIKNNQTFVTSCDKALFTRTNGVIYVMENGVIK